MALMTWSNKYSVGVETLDDQHKALMNVLNEFHAASMKGQAEQVAGPLLRQVTAISRQHFSAEESLMGPSNFRGWPRIAQNTRKNFGVCLPPRKGRRPYVLRVVALLKGLADQSYAGRRPGICKVAEIASRAAVSPLHFRHDLWLSFTFSSMPPIKVI